MSRAIHPVSPEDLMAYLDGELPVSRARECAVHLEQCAECQALAAELRLVGQQMMAWQTEPAPEAVSAAVTSAIDRHPVSPQPERRAGVERLRQILSRRPVWALAAVLCVTIFIGLVALSYQRTQLRSLGRPVAEIAPYLPQVAESLPNQRARLEQARRDYEAARQQFEQQELSSNLQVPRNESVNQPQMPAVAPAAPMIARTASVTLVVKDFQQSRAALDGILRQHGGYAAQLQSEAPEEQGRTLTATLRVPAGQLDSVLAEVKKLGRVERESQGGEEVTDQYVDVNARLSNARNTEQRLVEVLNQRTGKMADILAVENEIARVRGEIEQMEAQRQGLEHRVTYSELQVEVKEEYKAALDVTPPSEGAQLRNSLIEGLRAAANSLLGFVQIVAACLPSLLLWGLILFWPARWLWRRRRAANAGKASA